MLSLFQALTYHAESNDRHGYLWTLTNALRLIFHMANEAGLETVLSAAYSLKHASDMAPTQRQVPKSSTQLVDSACQRIHGLPSTTAEQRSVLIAFALTLPRWAWPEPPKPPGTHLHPQSRPRLLQERVRHLMDNNWGELLAHLQPTDEPPSHPARTPPRTPGLLTEADCRRLLLAGKQGRTCSDGVASSNDDTERMVQEKWLSAPLFAPQIRGHALSPADAKNLLTDERLSPPYHRVRDRRHGLDA